MADGDKRLCHQRDGGWGGGGLLPSLAQNLGEGVSNLSEVVIKEHFNRWSKRKQQKIRDGGDRNPFDLQALIYTGNQHDLVSPEIWLAPSSTTSMTISWLGPFFSLTYPKECLDFSLLPFCKPCGDITNFSWGHGYPQKG